MKHIFVTFLFFIISVHFNAQEKDSIFLHTLYEKSVEFEEHKNWDSAIFYSEKLLKESNTLFNDYYKLKAYNKLAKYYRINNRPFDAVYFYNKSKELNLQLGDTMNAINKLRYIASIQKRLGDYESSESSAIEALKLSSTLSDSLTKKLKIALYNHLGLVTKDQSNYKDAKNWYDKSLLLSSEPSEILAIKNNLALIYIKQGAFDQAMFKFKNLLHEKDLSQKSKDNARILDNLAYAKSKLKYPEAEKELLDALSLRKEMKDISGQFASYIHLAEHFIDNQDTTKALDYARKAYEIANTLKSATSKTEALSYLIRLEENPKESANAYYQLNDSITKARQQAKNQFAKIKYETEENRKTIEQLENEKARQALIIENRKIEIRLFASLIVIVIITTLFFYNYLQIKHRREKLKEAYKTEKRLSRKIHDELANDVYQVMTLLDTQQPTTDPSLLDKIEDIYERTRNISRDNSSIATGRNYAEELKQMLSRYGTDVTNIIINGLHNELWKNVPDYKKIELYRALQELMTNMRKHSKASLVAITFKKEGKSIHINYSDNGIGLHNSKILISNGLQNVENRISAIKGLIIFDKTSEKGLKIQLSFPV